MFSTEFSGPSQVTREKATYKRRQAKPKHWSVVHSFTNAYESSSPGDSVISDIPFAKISTATKTKKVLSDKTEKPNTMSQPPNKRSTNSSRILDKVERSSDHGKGVQHRREAKATIGSNMNANPKSGITSMSGGTLKSTSSMTKYEKSVLPRQKLSVVQQNQNYNSRPLTTRKSALQHKKNSFNYNSMYDIYQYDQVATLPQSKDKMKHPKPRKISVYRDSIEPKKLAQPLDGATQSASERLASKLTKVKAMSTFSNINSKYSSAATKSGVSATSESSAAAVLLSLKDPTQGSKSESASKSNFFQSTQTLKPQTQEDRTDVDEIDYRSQAVINLPKLYSISLDHLEQDVESDNVATDNSVLPQSRLDSVILDSDPAGEDGFYNKPADYEGMSLVSSNEGSYLYPRPSVTVTEDVINEIEDMSLVSSNNGSILYARPFMPSSEVPIENTGTAENYDSDVSAECDLSFIPLARFNSNSGARETNVVGTDDTTLSVNLGETSSEIEVDEVQLFRRSNRSKRRRVIDSEDETEEPGEQATNGVTSPEQSAEHLEPYTSTNSVPDFGTTAVNSPICNYQVPSNEDEPSCLQTSPLINVPSSSLPKLTIDHILIDDLILDNIEIESDCDIDHPRGRNTSHQAKLNKRSRVGIIFCKALDEPLERNGVIDELITLMEQTTA
ncbi:hypothetical protein BKA69DRAFT_1164220 [Paraphysoderma sedebokerense]|nr:hypothetical protein BKA69DRAFT_1164220 [Paraphysoderma sedebokerense]